MVKGPGMVILMGRSVLARRNATSRDLHRLPAADRADHPRHDLDTARRARGNLRRVVAVHAVERGGETVGVALAPHLAVGDDVDAGALLVADREQGGVVLRLLEPGRLDAPQLARASARRNDLRQAPAVDQPVGLRVAADQCRGQQGVRETFRHWRADAVFRWVAPHYPKLQKRDAGRRRSCAARRHRMIAAGGKHEASGCSRFCSPCPRWREARSPSPFPSGRSR